jgi:hypothetical protein
MLEGTLEYVLQGLRLGAEMAVVKEVLRPLAEDGRRLRVLHLSGHLRRPLLQAGHDVLSRDRLPPGEAPDVVCALAERDLIPGVVRLSQQVRPGGLVLLLSRRGQPARSALCAALLHAGLTDPVQRTTRMAVLTAGRRRAP